MVLPSQVQLQEVPLTSLYIDHNYQRPLMESRVHKICTAFVPQYMDPLKVCKRNEGGYFVIDGQHRLAVLRKLGQLTAPCLISNVDEAFDEVECFLIGNTRRMALRPTDIFRAKYHQNDAGTIAIENMINSYGYTLLASQSRQGEDRLRPLHCTGAVTDIYREKGPEICDRLFRLTSRIWHGELGQLDGVLLVGISIFLALYPTAFTDDEFVRKIGMFTTNDILQRGHTWAGTKRTGFKSGIAYAMFVLFNDARRTRRLPDMFVPKR